MLSVPGYRPDSCGNTLQGLNSSRWVLPSWPPGRGRPAAAGDRRGSVRNKTHVLAEQFGTTEHDGFRGPYLSGNTPEAAFHGQADRPCSRTCCTARPLISERTREAPLPWAPDDRSPQRTRRTAAAVFFREERRGAEAGTGADAPSICSTSVNALISAWRRSIAFWRSAIACAMALMATEITGRAAQMSKLFGVDAGRRRKSSGTVHAVAKVVGPPPRPRRAAPTRAGASRPL